MIGGIIFRRWRFFAGGSFGGAEVIEFVKRAVEGALDAGFIARKDFDGVGTGSVVGESARTGINV